MPKHKEKKICAVIEIGIINHVVITIGIITAVIRILAKILLPIAVAVDFVDQY